jgi:hypothetical protein
MPSFSKGQAKGGIEAQTKEKRGSTRSIRDDDVEYVRTNGFDQPNGQQIGAWTGLVFVTLAYFAIAENVALRWRPAA